ncbi:glycoside hydrolase family 3 N-terminal domain-containing protein [Demequina muriae]|uniref:beta-N-acetylhexosaminidase n=1 Tax=Demequina muriae TaxID=3051664 RepID=A0ABT8GHN0_9MICO|nr:glycoside hydrolase family 3 N-terminal domain-containing protein [Demequina sp. EGI L300058]MDN4480879.1 glycoside hydrolase family 3 N-terminal domain-containing protein [Demequina sp. EGI L300058]
MAGRRSAAVGIGAATVVAALLVSVAWWPAAQKNAGERIETAPSVTPSPAASAAASPTPSPPPPDLAWGPTADEWDAALETARALPLEEAAGQVIVASIASPSPEATEDLVASLALGGVIVMADAVTDVDGVRALTGAAQAGADSGARDWGAIVGVDQEGGAVARLRGLMPDLPSFMAAGAASDKASVRGVYAQAAVDMHAMGFTVDFAPVADATVGLADPTIRARSAGSDPERVSATVGAALAGFVDGGVVPVVKHFPGHGSVTQDSHDELPVQQVSLADLEARDMAPFASAIEAGAPAVMMAHIALPEWGDGPASLEPAAYEYLREVLGFEGVAMTDALNMGAIQDTHSSGQAAVAALAAGADLLLMPPDPRVARDAIVAAVDRGEVPRERLDEAAARMILLSRWQSAIEPEADEGRDYARELSAAGATVAARDCSAPFVGETVTIAGGWDGDRAALAAALEARGVTVGDEGTRIVLMGGDESSASADVVVAMAGPWGLSASEATVYVGLYGRSVGALAGLADVLVGDVEPLGEWPVDVDVPFDVC